MNDPITWAALVAATGACIGLAKFWIDRGKAEATAAAAQISASVAVAKTDLLLSQLNDFRVEVAQEYATTKALEASESAMTAAVNGIREEMRGMNSRLDQFLQAMLAK
jgi:hypothetical protein